MSFFDGFSADDSGDENGGTGSSILSSIISSAASVANTDILANANPVNAALLTNQPISTPQYSTGAAAFGIGSPNSSMIFILLLVVGLFAFFSLRK